MGLFTSLLTAVAAPVVKGFFANKAAKRAAKNRGVDYVKLRRDAEAAGFNPLTALLAGGGAGYQREFNPELSSGSFIAEAVARGAETYFNHVAERDAEAEKLKAYHAGKAERAARIHARTPSGTFGYDLTAQRPFLPSVSVSAASPIPPISRGAGFVRPPSNPLDKQDFIPVRNPDGSRGRLDASIARRLDIKPWDTVSVGDMEELVGDVAGGASAVALANSISKTATGEPLYDLGSPRLYGPAGVKYGPPPLTNSQKERKRKMRSKPYSGWMDDFFGGKFSQ